MKTGEAAPVSVPGDMAAASAESKMKKPAEAAREPVGETKVTTGTGEPSMDWMIARMELSRPHGVLLGMKIKSVGARAACTIPLTMYSERMGSISQSMKIREIFAGEFAAAAGAAGAAGEA